MIETEMTGIVLEKGLRPSQMGTSAGKGAGQRC
jgi:hypothetical protein